MDTVADDRRVLILEGDAAGAVVVPVTLNLFGRVEFYEALTLLDDVVKHLVNQDWISPTFQRDLAGGTSDGDAGLARAGETLD